MKVEELASKFAKADDLSKKSFVARSAAVSLTLVEQHAAARLASRTKRLSARPVELRL